MQVLFFSFVYSFLISHISGVYNKYNFIILYWFHVRQYVTRIFSTIHIGILDYDLFPESPAFYTKNMITISNVSSNWKPNYKLTVYNHKQQESEVTYNNPRLLLLYIFSFPYSLQAETLYSPKLFTIFWNSGQPANASSTLFRLSPLFKRPTQ